MTQVCVLLKQTRETVMLKFSVHCLFCSLLRLAEFGDVVWKLFMTREELWHGRSYSLNEHRSLGRGRILSCPPLRPGQENRQEKKKRMIIICTFLTYRTELSRAELNWPRRPCRGVPSERPLPRLFLVLFPIHHHHQPLPVPFVPGGGIGAGEMAPCALTVDSLNPKVGCWCHLLFLAANAALVCQFRFFDREGHERAMLIGTPSLPRRCWRSRITSATPPLPAVPRYAAPDTHGSTRLVL